MSLQRRVRKFAKGRKVVCLTPFLPSLLNGMIMRNDAGPIEFISLLMNMMNMLQRSG